MGKLEKILRREKRMMDMAEHQEVFCEHHQHYLTPYEVRAKRCYLGFHGTRYCRYVRFEQK
jgi:hypothetical protein